MNDVPKENEQNCNYLLTNIFAVTLNSQCLSAVVKFHLGCLMLQ